MSEAIMLVGREQEPELFSTDRPGPRPSNALTFKPPCRITMKVEEWVHVPDNPVQRNTEEHARRARHLFNPSPTHALAAMAVLPDGRRFKLDGHTRTYLWARGDVAPPPVMLIDVYECANQGDVEALYHHFDNKGAVETSRDMVFSAARAAKIEFKSSLMRAGRYVSAIKLVASMLGKPVPTNDQVALNAAIAAFRKPLELLDEVAPVSALFPSGVIMGAIAVFRRYDSEAKPFFVAYQKGEGTKDGVTMDAVQALTEALGGKLRSKDVKTVAERQFDLFQRTLSAYEAYRAGEKYRVGKYGGVRPMSEDRIRLFLSDDRFKR